MEYSFYEDRDFTIVKRSGYATILKDEGYKLDITLTNLLLDNGDNSIVNSESNINSVKITKIIPQDKFGNPKQLQFIGGSFIGDTQTIDWQR